MKEFYGRDDVKKQSGAAKGAWGLLGSLAAKKNSKRNSILGAAGFGLPKTTPGANQVNPAPAKIDEESGAKDNTKEENSISGLLGIGNGITAKVVESVETAREGQSPPKLAQILPNINGA